METENEDVFLHHDLDFGRASMQTAITPTNSDVLKTFIGRKLGRVSVNGNPGGLLQQPLSTH